jgi:hypothetical protein
MTIWILLLTALLAANLPWMSDRFLLILPVGERGKRVWMRLLEWLCLYFIIGALALGIETKATGSIHAQNWEFFAVTFCLFIVFALPGFIYRHDLKHLLDRERRLRRS